MGLIFAAVIVLAVAWLAARNIQHGLKKAPLPVRIGWWLTGLRWDGRQETNASWFRRGEVASNRRVRKFYERPRAWRAAQRCGTAGGVLFVAVAAVAAPVVVAWGAAVAGAGAAGFGVVVARRELAPAAREHRREVLTPLHERLWQPVGESRTAKPRDWLEVPRDRKTARVFLPDLYDASPKALEAVQRIVAQTVFVDNEPRMQPVLAGQRRYVQFEAALPPPPPKVLLDSDPKKGIPGLREAIEAAAWHELVIGYGVNGTLVKRSLGGDKPHWGLSIPSGGGKSVCAELLAAQMMFHGAICVILDYKWISHPWALFKMPNLTYAGTPAQIHLSLLWLLEEVERRKARALRGIQMDGTIKGDIGPPIFVVAEELNATIQQLKDYWKNPPPRGIDGRGESPAVAALRELLFTGRALGVHFLLIAQKLTVSSLGGKDGAARENCAGLLMGGQSSPPSWDMLAKDVVRPAKQSVPGRHYVVDGGNVELVQVGWLNPKGTPGPEARQLALAGTVTAVPEGIPQGLAKPVTPALESGQTGQVTGTFSRSALESASVPVPVTPAVDDLRDRPIGFAEACERGVITTWNPNGLRQQKLREERKARLTGGQSLFPSSIEEGARGEKLYWAADLREFERLKRGELVDV
jgi:hypothetical protein